VIRRPGVAIMKSLSGASSGVQTSAIFSAGLKDRIGRTRTSDLRVMSVIRSKTITLEITCTYGNSKELRPWTAETHGTHETPVFPFLMYRVMYRKTSHRVAMSPDVVSMQSRLVQAKSRQVFAQPVCVVRGSLFRARNGKDLPPCLRKIAAHPADPQDFSQLNASERIKC
jgi:hypothetical protein